MLPYYRKNLYVLCATTFLAAASWTQVIPFLPLFLGELGVTDNIATWSGFVYAMNFLSGIVMMPLWGRLADRVGRKAMVLRAGFCLSAIYFATAMATQPWHVAVTRFLNGALTGFIPMSTALVATNTPRELSARYVAVVQTASAAGTIIGPVIGGTLASMFGIRGAMYVSGTLVFLSTLLVLGLVKEPTKPQQSTVQTSLIGDFRMALQTPILWVCMFLAMIASIANVGVQPILALHIESLMQATIPWLTGLVFTLPGLAFVLTATRWVRLYERHGFQKAANWAFWGAGITSVISGLTGNTALFAFMFFASSVFLAALRPISAAMVATEVEASFHGRAFGIQSAAMTFGGLIGPLGAGAVAGALGNHAVFVALGLLLVASPFIMQRHLTQANRTRPASVEEAS